MRVFLICLVLYSLLQLFAILSVPKALSKYSIGVRLSVSNPLSRRWMQVVDPGDLVLRPKSPDAFENQA
jgi:hypothetical protein